MISVVLIEDIRDIRIPLAEYLSEQLELRLIVSSESIEDYYAMHSQDNLPDVILLDIGLPGISGLVAIEMLKKRMPNTEIIMLTIHEDADRIFKALQAGASGYLIKNAPLAKIKEAIINVVDGGAPMTPAIARKVIKFFGRKKKIQKKILLQKKNN
ncbi:MAG: response regulator transcription factor [Melioribacteraceae bacterium]